VWTDWVADGPQVRASSLETDQQSQQRRRRVRRGWFWTLGVLGILGGLLVALLVIILVLAASDTDKAGRPLVQRVEQVHAQLEVSGLPCRDFSVDGPAFGASEDAVGICRLDAAHANAGVLIYAGANGRDTVEGPAVVGPNWHIDLLHENNSLLQDIAKRLDARCVNCAP
jgi:hypothetical protein